MYLQSPNIISPQVHPLLLEEVVFDVIIDQLLSSLSDGHRRATFLFLRLDEFVFRHPYDNLEEFITAKLFVGVIFEVGSSAANLLKIYRHEQLVDDLRGQVSFFNDSPSLA